ncbi:Uncharacterised protein [Dermatophilus congolensis]|uniref:MetS family NSS transporter small subunit n=1 Tax=Dermatophilus congolensis TaxID=1863 RepID=A0AA46BLQ0_9MICO|nr:methionine/alanine import family NSS transporter small subunit [Dermatophilus congolensis]STD05090.1 Uncharacterised protein [Dermatophilus congolensis]
MSTIAIVMMTLFGSIIWGGLTTAIIYGSRGIETDAAKYLSAHPEIDA